MATGAYQAGDGDVRDPDEGEVEPLPLVQRGEGDHAPGRVKQDHRLENVTLANVTVITFIQKTAIAF